MDYNDKLRLAKEALESGSYDKKTIEHIFPELKESEDEKIRKELIRLFQSDTPQQFGEFTNKQFIAWLEKQGDLKSFKDEDVRKFMQYIEKEAKAYEFNLPNRSYDIYAFAKDILVWLEKQDQGEHRIAWSDEDEYLLNETTRHLEELIRIDKAHCGVNVQYYQRDIDWLKSLKDRIRSKQGGQSFNIQWHDVTEEPDEMREIFCEWKTNDATRHAVVFYQADTKTFWDYELRIVNVVKWAYVDEILPKQN